MKIDNGIGPSSKTCECGCGGIPNAGRRFIRYHNTTILNQLLDLPSRISKSKKGKYYGGNGRKSTKICECGCGKIIAPSKRFVLGHHLRVEPYKNTLGSNLRLGNLTPRHWSEESRNLMSKKMKGRKLTPEHREKIRLAGLGQKRPFMKEVCNRPELRAKVSERTKGDRNPNWKGGIPPVYGKDWPEIRKLVLTRDNFLCQVCDSDKNLTVHHIMQYRSFKENRIDWLVTLCRNCHLWCEAKYSKLAPVDKILLFSGGIDSTVAYFLLDRPAILYCCIGHRYLRPEFITVLKFTRRNKANLYLRAPLDLSQFEEPNANIPARNSFLAHISSYLANKIYLVAQLGEQSIPDRSPEFFKLESELLTLLWEKPKVLDCVFPSDTKQDLVKRYLDAGFPKEDLHLTYSCGSQIPGRCGRCQMCLRTAVALDYNGILPPNFFKQDIWEWSGTRDFLERIQRGEIEERRAQQSLQVLENHIEVV